MTWWILIYATGSPGDVHEQWQPYRQGFALLPFILGITLFIYLVIRPFMVFYSSHRTPLMELEHKP